jgi:hypothetical protein
MALSETQTGRDPDGRVEVASTSSGLPPITQIAFSTCRAHYPGGSIRFFGFGLRCAPASGLSRIALAFPEQRAGRHPQLSFRGLLKLHSRYGLQTRSPTLCGLCHEAPIPSVHPAKRPVSYPVIPTTPGVGLSPTGNLRPLGRTFVSQKAILPRSHPSTTRQLASFRRIPRATQIGFVSQRRHHHHPNWLRSAKTLSPPAATSFHQLPHPL